MSATEYQFLFIITILPIVVGGLSIFLYRRWQTIKYERRRKAILQEILQLAQEQNEIFDLKISDKELNTKGVSATMQSSNQHGLDMEVLTHVSVQWTGAPVDVYFRVMMPEGAVFYKFASVIKGVLPGREKSHILIAEPKDLDVGQKRNFVRVTPHASAVRVVGLWNLEQGKPIPRSTGEIGSPLMHYKLGMKSAAVRIENVSGTGLALNFKMQDRDTMPVDLEAGSQVLCLIIYAQEDKSEKGEKLSTFWCTAEIVNIRIVEEESAMIAGAVFTNWALLEQGKTDIHWFHSSPSRGVGPITQWVMNMDMKQRMLR